MPRTCQTSGQFGSLIHIVLVSILLMAGTSTVAIARERVALVIGNSTYANVPALPNPANDAADMAAALERLGFNVTRVINAERQTMLDALRSFEQRAANANIGIVFFAGHGVEVDGINYLVPVDAKLAHDVHVYEETITLQRVLASVGNAKKLRLVLLDACRDDPFRTKMVRSAATRSIGRGLARIEPPGSTLVAYAAKEQTVAEDGRGRNSPFTQSLLRYIETPGLEINFLFRAVRDDVMNLTNRRQEPFIYGSLTRDPIYLKDSTDGGPTLVPGIPADEVAWNFVDKRSVGELLRFIDRFPDSPRRADAERLKKELEPVAVIPAQQIPRGSATGRCFEFAGQRYCQ